MAVLGRRAMPVGVFFGVALAVVPLEVSLIAEQAFAANGDTSNRITLGEIHRGCSDGQFSKDNLLLRAWDCAEALDSLDPHRDIAAGAGSTMDRIAKFLGGPWACANADNPISGLECGMEEVTMLARTAPVRDDLYSHRTVFIATPTFDGNLGALNGGRGDGPLSRRIQFLDGAVCSGDDGIPIAVGCGTEEIAGSGDPEPAGGEPESKPSKTVFITSQMFDGDLGGLEGADEKCNRAAHAAGLSGTFKAWLSDSSSGPADRFVRSKVPYVRTDGVRIADDWNDLVTCDQGVTKRECLDAPLKVDENGSALGGFLLQAWSNTGTDGTPGTAVMGPVVNCSDWKANDPVVELMGATGQARLMGVDQLDADWSGVTGVAGCYVPNHLFCFEQ